MLRHDGRNPAAARHRVDYATYFLNAMITSTSSSIVSWHAHIYFDSSTRDAAWALRERILAEIGERMEMGRFHERPVGPHPQWSYQVAFAPAHLGPIIAWLTLHRGHLDIFFHPNTGDALADHRDRAGWLGHSYPLNLQALGVPI